jgi:hypothetical protein
MFAASKSGRAAAAATDPYFPYVPLLLETTSTNGQQNNTFLDSSTNNFTITRNGTPTQGSVTPYWPNGYWGNYFNGSSDVFTAANATALQLNATSWTIEAYIYLTASTAAYKTVFSKRAGVTAEYEIGVDPSGFFYFYTSTVYTSTFTASPNTWIHLAVTCDGTNTYMFANGALVKTNSGATAGSGTAILNIAFAGSGNAQYFPGYISNIRIVKGQALSTVAFTPPVAPVTINTVGWNNSSAALSGTVSFLISQSNRFKDNSANNFTLTVSGTPRVQAFQPFSPVASYTTAAYGGSGYFDGTSGQYLNTVANAAFNFGTSNFTVEGWLYPTSTTGTSPIFEIRTAASNVTGFAFLRTSGALTLNVYQNGFLGASTNSLVLNSWNHVALVRSTNTWSYYINGVASGSFTNTTSITDGATTGPKIGGSTTAGEVWIGYISNLRVNNGTAVYTGAFTPPTLAPLTTAGSTSAASYSSTTNVNTSFASSATSLLTNFTNAGIYDAAVQNNAITVGDSQSSTTQYKWSPTSMKFDGTGDWLTAIDGPQLQLLTGDFTIDGWVYLSAISVAYGIISKGTATTGWSVNVTALNKLQFSYTASVLTGATSLATGTWYYFAVVRSGSATGNLKIYLNGTADATSGGAVTDNFNQTSILYVGADRIGTSALNGYLQDVRITKYARTITTPTAAFPTR